MYGKVFVSMFDGTLRQDWEALVTFQQMIVLADQDGVVDMTAEAIHYRTGIPLDHITNGIAVLEAPDPGSRAPAKEGRRILRLNEHRAWGWKIVNYQRYLHMGSAQDRKERDAERKLRKRKEEAA